MKSKTKIPSYPKTLSEEELKKILQTEEGKIELAKAMVNPIRGSAPSPFVAEYEDLEEKIRDGILKCEKEKSDD